ncbi:MAG TPA: hypothetical protein VNN12_02825 [Dehalococcoidia bacterium]|nr:hypothetical protein [Dehalococcoidia bacterium]
MTQRIHGYLVAVVVSVVGLIALGALSVRYDFQTIFAAILAITPTLLLVLFQEYVNVPELEFVYDEEDQAEFRPELDPGWRFADGSDLGPTQWLRVGVRNRGRATARRCRGELAVLSWPTTESGDTPSSEPKRLRWSSAGGLITALEPPGALSDIAPGGLDHLEALVNPRRRRIEKRTTRDGGVLQQEPLVAWVSTPSALLSLDVLCHPQNGFTSGQYRVLLRVTADNVSQALTAQWELELARLDDDRRTQFVLRRASS